MIQVGPDSSQSLIVSVCNQKIRVLAVRLYNDWSSEEMILMDSRRKLKKITN
jgi:hypothetical protein